VEKSLGDKTKMPQTTSKASEIMFYVICFMIILTLAFGLTNLFKVNSLSSNLKNSCTCTGGSCDLRAGNSDPYGLVKVMNYLKYIQKTQMFLYLNLVNFMRIKDLTFG
jgi:hypothetical protein